MASESFARFVSLACHDLRTPLATVAGFAHTLERMDDIVDPAARYIGMMKSAGDQMGELLDALGLVARIEAGRYEPALVEADTLELAQARRGEDRAGRGQGLRRDRSRRPRADGDRAGGARAVRSAPRGSRAFELTASESTVEIAPIPAAAAPIVLAEDLKDLGAAAARRLTEAIGGASRSTASGFSVRLPV